MVNAPMIGLMCADLMIGKTTDAIDSHLWWTQPGRGSAQLDGLFTSVLDLAV
jgi:hypothetical protein